MTAKRNESTVSITGVAPGVIMALRRAAVIAAQHGHNWLGTEDLLAALLEPRPIAPLQVHWQLNHPGQALTYDQVRELAESIIPGAPVGSHGPAEPVQVSYELSGPHADEFDAAIRQADNWTGAEIDPSTLDVVDTSKLGDEELN